MEFTKFLDGLLGNELASVILIDTQAISSIFYFYFLFYFYPSQMALMARLTKALSVLQQLTARFLPKAVATLVAHFTSKDQAVFPSPTRYTVERKQTGLPC